MDFSFTREEELFRCAVREFCEETIAPQAARIDENAGISDEIIEAMAKAGLLGITVSEGYGGKGAGFTMAAIAAEEIARADMSMATAVYYLVEAGWGFIFERYGTEQAKEEVLPEVVQGKTFLGIASTEATGGSDIASTSTSMTRKDGHLVVNGAKSFISGVKEAAERGGGFVTVVKTDPSARHRGLSLCYLPVKNKEGIAISTSRQMGREGISNGFIQIQDAEIPDSYLIGEWNKGFYYAMEGFNCARTLVSAACIGAAEKALESGIEHLKKRRLFGAPLSKFEGIQFQLAEDHVRLESAKLLVYRAAWMIDRMYSEKRFSHGKINGAVAAAKLTAPAAAFDIIKDVMMWHGALGYTKEAGFERGLRGVASYIMGAEGAMNIMKIIIGKEILGKENVS
jgi:alkylation response protein AidB-like acyl-CoA dehydrogenase